MCELGRNERSKKDVLVKAWVERVALGFQGESRTVTTEILIFFSPYSLRFFFCLFSEDLVSPYLEVFVLRNTHPIFFTHISVNRDEKRIPIVQNI